MKKLLTIGIILIIAIGKFNILAYASSYNPVKSDIVVEVKEGGTVTITPSVNSPIPDKTSLYIKDGEYGKLQITFTSVGVYDYTVKSVPDKRKLEFDDKEYKVRIYVTDEGGELVSTIIASTSDDKYSAHSDVKGYMPYGPERLVFNNSIPKEKPTKKNNKDDSKNDKDENNKKNDKNNKDNKDGGNNVSNLDKNKNPKTEDDSKMEFYFLIAMLASAGLLLLSIFDLRDTQKMIKEVKDS